VSGHVIVAPMSFTPKPISIGPETHATPMSAPIPWPSVLPGFEYCVNVRPIGFTGFDPANSVSLVESPTRPSVRP